MKALVAALSLAAAVASPAAAEPFFVVSAVALEVGAEADYLALQKEAARFWDKHGIEVVVRFAVDGGAPEGFGPIDHAEVFRIPAMEAFRNYARDPAYADIRTRRPSLRTRAVTFRGAADGGARWTILRARRSRLSSRRAGTPRRRRRPPPHDGSRS